MVTKENDLILNMLANPQFTVTDFQAVGLSSDNTALRPESEYVKSEKITQNENFLDVNGEFDPAKFHKFYEGAGSFYNILATDDYNKKILDLANYSMDNIWVDKEKRTIDYAPKLSRQQNERLVTNSLERIGKKGKQTLSTSEIAQTLQVYDTSTGEWTDSPNDSFFSNFTNTLVLATYDEDKFDDDGNKIHSKGQLKYNEDGLPYYETLGGRDVYGKQVLNKMNMITTDGSFANKFDFFDSDDIDLKNLGATILKNAALVGTMFIPGGVGATITGLSVATQTVGLLATMGKLLAGNDNETLNNILGWAKSVNRSAQTEYAAQHTWCGENFLNMIGDTVGLLAELRWIFKATPSIIQGNSKVYKALSSTKGREQVITDTEKVIAEASKNANTEQLLKSIKDPNNLFKLKDYYEGVSIINRNKAVKAVDDLIEKGMKYSSPLSKAYMTGITVLDTYGEAKEAGASDMEAALLTIGYAGAEAKLLNTGLGEWILPELKGNKFKHKAIINALGKDLKDVYKSYSENGNKIGLIQNILNVGAKIAKNKYALEAGEKGIKSGLSVVGAHAAGEAFEEVSEEVLADFSKSVFNITRWLRGKENLELGQWENMSDRYLMSALGGFIGGGITSAATDFNTARSLANMDKTLAMQELLYIANNNEGGTFLKELEKTTVGDPNLSAKNIIAKSDLGVIYAEGDKDDNQDKEIKKAIKSLFLLLTNLLNSEGARISKNSLLNTLTLEDLKSLISTLKFNNLRNASVLGMYLLDFQNLQSDIVATKAKIMGLESSAPNDNANISSTALDEISHLTEHLNELRKEKDSYLNGNLAPEAIRDAVFEMNPILNKFFVKTNLILYAEHKFKKKWGALSDAEKEEATKNYKEESQTNLKSDIHTRAGIFLDMMELYTPYATLITSFLEQLQKQQFEGVRNVINLTDKTLKALNSYNTQNENFDLDNYMANISDIIASVGINAVETIHSPLFTQSILDLLQAIKNKPLTDAYTIMLKKNEYANVVYLNVLLYVDTSIKKFKDLGYINPEVKNSVLLALSSLDEYAEKQQQWAAEPAKAYFYRLSYLTIINLKQDVRKLAHTPIIDYLNKFQLSVTNSDINLVKHWENTMHLFLENSEDLSDFHLDPEWQETNDEALHLIDGFITVVEGLKNDNADINNPTGYSRMLNNVYKALGVKDYVPLAEIDTNIANQLILDANMIKDRLTFAKTLSAVNTGLKLKQLERVGVNTNFLLYNSYKRLINVIPDDWLASDDVIKLKGVFNSLTDLESFVNEDNIKLNREDSTTVASDLHKLELAVFDFFQKLKNLDGSFDVDKLSDLLEKFAGSGGFFAKTDSLLTEYTKSLDDNAFIWHIASKALVNPTDFAAAYKDALTEDIAPIPSQELAIYLGVAAITNMNGLNSFVDAYRKTVIKDFNNKSESERASLLNQFDGSGKDYATTLLKYFGGHDVLPQYHNLIFIEGIPGAGKSTGVLSMVKRIVDKIDPSFMDNMIYAHSTEKNAQKSIDNLGFKGLAMDRKKLLSWISSEWRDITEQDESKRNKKGIPYLYDDSYYFDNEGRLRNKWKLNHYTDVPKFIFIDEVSHYNLLELAMISLFAEENGIVVITAGDIDLDVLEAAIKVPEYDDDLIVTINRNTLIRTPKLGVSLRTLNRLMTETINMMQANQDLLRQGKAISLNFKYLDSDPNHKGLYGVHNFLSLSSVLTEAELEPIMASVKLMIETLKPEEKIGYIYHSKESPLYKKLMTEYKDKINLYAKYDASGLEGLYYIVENDISANTDPKLAESVQYRYMRELYTGISRAELGAIVITPSSYGSNIRIENANLDTIFLLEPLTKAAIAQTSEHRRVLLETILEGANTNPLTINSPNIKKLLVQPKLNPTHFPPTPPTPPLTPPVKIGKGYTKKEDAETELLLWLTLVGDTTDLRVKNTTLLGEYKIKQFVILTATELGQTIYIPSITFGDDTLDFTFSKEDFDTSFYEIIDINNKPKPSFSKNLRLLIKYQNKDIIVKVADVIENPEITYVLTDDLGKTLMDITQTNLQSIYQGLAPTIIPPKKKTYTAPTTHLENGGYLEAVGGANAANETEPEILVKNHLAHIGYTHDTFEVGLSNVNNKPYYKGPKGVPPAIRLAIYDARIDSGIGLLKILGPNITYQQLKDILAFIHNEINTNTSNADLALVLKTKLKLKGNVKVSFALKSSAGNNVNHPDYYRYFIDPESEDLEYIYSEDLKAKKPKRFKMVMILSEDGENKLEIPTVTLNSPLTVMLILKDGQLIYPTVYPFYLTTRDLISNLILATGKYSNLSIEDAKKLAEKDAIYPTINALIKKFDGKLPQSQDLIDLFKLWQFTSNGIFYLDDNFNLAQQHLRGPELTIHKGDKLLNGQLEQTKEFRDIEEMTKNPSLHISSILISNDGKINDKQIPGLHAGHSFILVSDTNKLLSDLDLVTQYIKLVEDPNEPILVTMWYVVPPHTTVEGWLRNQHNLYEVALGKPHLLYDIGNEWTAYRVLESLIETNTYDKLFSSDETKDEIRNAVRLMNLIEEKWNKKDIPFKDSNEKQVYENLKSKIGEEDARYSMRISELGKLLENPVDWKSANNPINKTLGQRFNSYLTNIVWQKTPGGPKVDESLLKVIENACANSSKPLKEIYYKVQYSDQNVGPFVKVVTINKYSLGNTPTGEKANFQINAAIHTRSFIMDNLYSEIHNIVLHIQFNKDSKVWLMDDMSRRIWGERYLKKTASVHTPTVSEKIKTDYNKYFKNGLLNSNLLDDSLSYLDNLIKLVNDYNVKKGNFGFIYNNKIYLTLMSDITSKVVNPLALLENASTLDLEVKDNLGNISKITLEFEVDSSNGVVNKIICRNTNLNLVNVSKEFKDLQVSDADLKFFKDVLDFIATKLKDPKRVLTPCYKYAANSKEDLLSGILKDPKLNYRQIKTLLTRLRDKTLIDYEVPEEDRIKMTDIINNILTYVSLGRSYNIHKDDTVQINNTRYKIIDILGNDITGVIIDQNDLPIDLNQYIFSDDDIKNMKIEEMVCAPTIWKLI